MWNCRATNLICRTFLILLDFHNEPEALNLTSAFELDGSLSVDNRRRSARIAKKSKKHKLF